MPYADDKRALSERYLGSSAYAENNLFTCTWSSNNFGELDFNCLYPILYGQYYGTEQLISSNINALTGYATVGLRTAGSGLHEQLYEGYSAPEQYSTAEFEGRYTDEYSLAAVVYRMVCGQSPVPAAQRLVSDSNPRARTVNSAVPGYVSDVLQMGLRLKPMERIQTVPQLVQALSSKEYTDCLLYTSPSPRDS